MPIDCPRRLPKNSFIDGTTTGPNRCSAGVEDRNANAMMRPEGSQPALCPVQLPARGQDTSIFTAIGVAKHHLLPAMAHLQMRAIDRMSECAFQYICTCAQVLVGLK